MTLLWMDGFDLGDQAIRGYLGFPGSSVTQTAFGYGRAVAQGGGAYLVKEIPPSSRIITGLRLFTGCTLFVQGDAGATMHLTVFYQNDGSLTLRRGDQNGTVLASMPATTYSTGGWIYVELEATISDTVGIANVRVNGSPSNTLSYTGDTKNGGTSTNIDRVGALCPGIGSPLDDFYICDTTGTENNTFLGDVRVVTLAPNGNGASSQLVGSDGNSTDNYLLVDEQPYGTSDYVGSGTVGQRDTYPTADLPAGTWTVKAAQTVAVVQKSDAGAASIKTATRSGGTNYYGSTALLSPSWATIRHLMELNPATAAAWTQAEINAVEVGVEVA